jgi:hypothetical protein
VLGPFILQTDAREFLSAAVQRPKGIAQRRERSQRS